MARRRVDVGAADLAPGERRLVEVNGRSVGVFNVGGTYYALYNRCPHMGGNLCAGPVTGTTLDGPAGTFVFGRQGEIVRCAWHGWEFDITTGACLVEPRLRVRRYPVTVQDGRLILHL